MRSAAGDLGDVTPGPARAVGRGPAPAARDRARVGLLSLQGDYALHAEALASLGAEPVRVSLPEHLHDLDALIVPGGESTTMLRLLEATGLRAGVDRFVRERPVLGTCAGLILLAREADRLPAPTLGAIDIRAERNAWGRQVHSFTDTVDVAAFDGTMRGVFIRAPRITHVGRGVEVVARYRGEPVGVRQGLAVAIAFHPELTDDRRLHAWFLRDVAGVDVRDAAGDA